MRILYVNSLYPTAGDRRPIGGAETLSVRVVRGLLEAGHDVRIVRSGVDSKGGVERTPEGVEVHSLPCRNIYPMLDGKPHDVASRFAWHLIEDRGRVAPAFRRVLTEYAPDLVHTNNVVGMTTDVWRVAHEAGYTILHTLHDYYLTCPKVLRFSKGAPCAKTCLSCTLLSQQRRKAAQLVDKVIGVSRHMLEIHRAEGLFTDTPSQVILNMPPPRASGPNLTLGSQALGDSVHQTKARVPLPPRPLGARPVFGYIGRQALEKGIFELLEAFVTLEPGSARLVVAGVIEPAVKEWVAKNAPQSEDITFTGFTTQDAFFPTIDVVVIPSLWEEPCSMCAGEAFSFGVPALGSKRGGIPEIVESGRLGWVYEPGTGELAALLAHLVANPAEIAARSATVRGLQLQDQGDQLVASYLDVYAQMIDDTNRSRKSA